MRRLLLPLVIAFVACEERNAAELEVEPAARRMVAASARDPDLHVSSSGAIHALVAEVGAEGYEVVLRGSQDGGDSYFERVAVSRSPGEAESHGETSPVLLVGLHMSWTALWEARVGGAKRLRAASSVDFAKSFDEPVDVPVDSRFGFFNAALALDGTLVVAYLSHESHAAALRMTSSGDGGKSFAPPVTVASSVCPCCRPSVAAGERGWAIVWRSVGADDARDIAVASSTDRGASWSEPSIVSADGWRIAGCPHSGAALLAAGGRLYTAWATAADGEYRAFVSHSNDSTTFAPRVEIFPDVRAVNHPRLAAVGERVFAVAQGRDSRKEGGFGKTHIYLRQIAPALGSAVVLPPSPGSAVYPRLHALGPKEILAAWTDSSDLGTSIWAARARLTGGPS